MGIYYGQVIPYLLRDTQNRGEVKFGKRRETRSGKTRAIGIFFLITFSPHKHRKIIFTYSMAS